MTKVKADLSAKYIAALDLCRAHGDVRYYLEGIYIEPIRGGGVYMVATNGHIMLVIRDDEAYANRSFILKTRKDLVAACKYSPRKRSHINESVTRTIIVNGFIYAMKEWYEKDEDRNVRKPAINNPMLAHAAFPFEEIEGKFPNWRQVLPSDKQTDEYQNTLPFVYFNPEHIEVFRKAFKVAGGRPDMGVRMTFSHPQKSISIRPAHFNLKDTVFGVLMPMYGDIPHMPDWINKEKEKTDDR